MMNSEEIHRSVVDEAEDIEEIREDKITVGDVFRNLAQHPLQILMRWNWKAALLGAIFRASFYFTVYKTSKESWMVTLTAVLLELVFRFFTGGISGALVQSFRKATPTWLATMIITISLPLFSHIVEFITHYSQENLFSNVFAASENKAREKAFAVSVLISALSAIFNIFIMQRGVLLVGAGKETKSLWGDVKRIPHLVVEFMSILPIKILTAMRDGRLLSAFGMFAGFGLAVGAILGAARGKWSWAWTTALGAWAALFVALLITSAVLRFMHTREAKS
jgi:hypothetical protein